MSHIQFPEGVEFERVVVVSEDRNCEHCGRYLHARDTKHRRVWSKAGATHLVVPALHCPNPTCAGHKVTVRQEAELAVALPYWSVTWDLFAWMGHRRFCRHWSVPQIRSELADRFGVHVSPDWVEDYVRRYQTMVAAREADVELWASDYQDVEDVILTIDGLQPEKGHETLYVVREVRAKRVWFAVPLLSSSKQEVRRLFERAKQMAARLGKPIRCWMSDKQEAFVTEIADVFPGVPHRYCANHFLRDVAKPVLEADSHAKVKMRRKVRGLRKIEKRLLQDAATERAAVAGQSDTADNGPAAHVPDNEAASHAADNGPAAHVPDNEAASHAADNGPAPHAANNGAAPHAVVGAEAPQESPQAADRQVVLDYCSVVRGILNDDQGGPIRPPGLRMSEALHEVAQSIERSLTGKKGGPTTGR